MLKKYPAYKYILAFADLALLLSSFGLAVRLRFAERSFAEFADEPFFLAQIIFFVVYALVWIVIFQHFNLYKINIFLSAGDQIVAVVKSLVYGLIGMIVISFFIKNLDWIESRAAIFYFLGFSFFP